MKKFTLFAILLAVISVLFLGCEPQQSEMNLSNLTDTATISGALVYDAGVDTTGSVEQYAVNQIKPVANRIIYVEIPYASYNLNAEQKGSKIYETVTDLDGNFTISIPTTSLGLKNVTVRMQEFTAYKSEYTKMEGSTPIFETELYRYEWKKENITLKPGSIDFLTDSERRCTESKVSIDELKETITLTGNIKLAYEAGFRKGIYKAAANATVEFEAEYPEGFDGVLTAGTVTDAQGNYRITLPLKSYKDGFSSLNVRVLGLAGDPYVHYSTATDKQTLTGAYVAEDILSFYSASDIIEGMEHKMKTMYLRFSPGYTNNLANTVVPSTYTTNLVGWEKYDGFTETITVSGKYLLATSNGYGLGTYTNTIGEGVFRVNYGDYLRGEKVLYAPVNADGTFSFELPATDKNEKFEVVCVADNTKEYRYTHYKNEKDVIEIGGTYSIYQEVKEIGMEWNDLGSTYLKFTPSSNITSEQLTDINWNPYLAGWVINPDKKEKATISANLYFPKETKFGVGAYAPADVRIFTIQVDGVYYAAPIKAGKFQLEIPVENSNEQFDVYFASYDIEGVNDYVHYTSAKGDKQNLNGKYVKRVWIGEDKADRKVWNELGDIYFKFEPDDTYDKTLINWNDNLADWHKSVEKTQIRKLYVDVNLAVETGYAKGKYEPANGLIFEITDGSYIYAAPAENGKVTFNVLVKDEFAEVSAIWNPNAITYPFDDFVHYYDGETGKTRKLDGYYSDYILEQPLDGDSQEKLGTIYLKYNPNYSSSELQYMNWFDNLAGWVADRKLKVSKTVVGSLRRAIETGFWQGSFTPAAFEKVVVEVDGVQFVGATDVDGNYSIDVRLEYDETPSIAVYNEIESKVYNFDHYRRANTTDIEKIEVKYGNSFSDYKEGLDNWYNRRSTYYRVISHTPVDYWTDNIAGWVNERLKVTQGYTKTLTIKGVAKRAIEKKDASNNWAASWENDKYRMLEISVLGRTYRVAANSNGNYTLPIAVENVETDYTGVYVEALSDADDNAQRVKFIHYPEVDKSNSKVLLGRFQDAGVVDGSVNYTVTNNAIEIKEPCVKSLFVPSAYEESFELNYNWDPYTD